MKKAWTISYTNNAPGRGNGAVTWHTWKSTEISQANAENELKRAIEQDRNGYSWALFEMVAAFEVKKELVPVVLEEMVVQPLEAVPGPVMNDNPDDDDDFFPDPDFDPDFDD